MASVLDGTDDICMFQWALLKDLHIKRSHQLSLTIAMPQDVKWQVGSEYSPMVALAQGLKSLALNETRVLSRTITDWFRSL